MKTKNNKYRWAEGMLPKLIIKVEFEDKIHRLALISKRDQVYMKMKIHIIEVETMSELILIYDLSRPIYQVNEDLFLIKLPDDLRFEGVDFIDYTSEGEITMSMGHSGGF